VDTDSEFHALMERFQTRMNIIPLFIKEPDGNLEIVPVKFEQVSIEEDSHIVCLGKPLAEESS
jgi:hypothetical protein